jgi:hypothetical protein
MARLNLERRECSMCLTWSFNSRTSSVVQPLSELPSGKTANGSSPITELIEVCRCGRSETNFSSRSAVSPAVSSSKLGAGLDRVYVGVRLSRSPRLGTKREFWTLVRVDKVDTSGSLSRQFYSSLNLKERIN